MFSGIDSSGNRVLPTLDVRRATCPNPDCGGELIAKTGEKVRHHFAHKSGVECDTAYAPMTEWHFDWQACFPYFREHFEKNEAGEVHRADVYLPAGVTIEFQHSQISRTDIEAREQFWTTGDRWLIWVLSESRAKDMHMFGASHDRVIVLPDYDGMLRVLGTVMDRGQFTQWAHDLKPRDLISARNAARRELYDGFENWAAELERREAELADETARRETALANQRAKALADVASREAVAASRETAVAARETALAGLEAAERAKAAGVVAEAEKYKAEVEAWAASITQPLAGQQVKLAEERAQFSAQQVAAAQAAGGGNPMLPYAVADLLGMITRHHSSYGTDPFLAFHWKQVVVKCLVSGGLADRIPEGWA